MENPFEKRIQNPEVRIQNKKIIYTFALQGDCGRGLCAFAPLRLCPGLSPEF
jgi:hypothetical protein